MSTAPWKAKFNQPISGYDPVEAQGLSELGYALQRNQIPQEEYLSWARETFELPSVDMKFFQSQSPPKKLFNKWKDAYAWGPECLPVGEWDEHLLIAGLTKPDDLPVELKPIFLLAPIQGLLTFWGTYQEESDGKEESSSEEIPEEAGGLPDGFMAPATSESTTKTSLSFSGVKLASHDEAPVMIKEEGPVAIDEKTLASAPSPAEVKIQVNTQDIRPPLANINGKPTGPAATAAAKVAASPTAKVEQAKPVAAKPTIPGAKPGLVVPQDTAHIAVNTAAASSSYTMPPLNPKVPPPPPPKGSASAHPTVQPTAAVKPVTLGKPELPELPKLVEEPVKEIKAQPQILDSVPLPNVPPSSGAPVEGLAELEMDPLMIKGVFAECAKHYEKQLYIQYSEAGKYAIARQWPDDFVASETPSKHTINEDSFLAVVFKTQKPYHGYVVKNAVSDKFFSEVNAGQTPENITLVPLIKNDVVVGALMGWGPKTTYNMTVLRALEKSIYNLSLKLGWSTPEAA